MTIKKILLGWAVGGLVIGTVLVIISLSPLVTPYTPLNTPPSTPSTSILSATSSAIAVPTLHSELLTQHLFLVTHVIDGDTFEIESGEKVRLIGIDTPETVDPHRLVGCYGPEASNKSKEVLTNQRVRLEKDITDKDKYGRILRYVYLVRQDESSSAYLPQEGATSAIFYNDYLVKEGYAKSYPYPPDTKYQELFNRSQMEAKLNKKGLWGRC